MKTRHVVAVIAIGLLFSMIHAFSRGVGYGFARHFIHFLFK